MLAALIVISTLAGSAPEALAGKPRGIDVSHHQGRIRWQRVSKTGVDFAFVKATEGMTVKDPKYRKNRQRAQRVGIEVGAYHFARPGGAKRGRIRKDARWEARWFLKNAKPKKKDLRPVLDLETSGPLKRRELVRWTDEWVTHVRERTGTRPIVYTGPTFWNDRMRGTRRFARTKHPLWVAHYTRKRPDVPASGWNGLGWTIWQFTDCGRVRGIKGCVDLNRLAESDLGSLSIGPSDQSHPRTPAGKRGAKHRKRPAKDQARPKEHPGPKVPGRGRGDRRAGAEKRPAGSHGAIPDATTRAFVRRLLLQLGI